MDTINERIAKEIDLNAINDLLDVSLLEEYKRSSSVKACIKKLSTVLTKYGVERKDEIINEYLPVLIPPGTKGVIRGNRFNLIVKNFINSMRLTYLKDLEFEIKFETKCKLLETSEIPDWYIIDTTTNKALVGMNQVDLWSGGAQLNRGSKYINSSYSGKSKLICVVCNNIKFKNTKSKAYKLFEIGYRNNTLCYLGNLKNIILNFFEIPF